MSKTFNIGDHVTRAVAQPAPFFIGTFVVRDTRRLPCGEQEVLIKDNDADVLWWPSASFNLAPQSAATAPTGASITERQQLRNLRKVAAALYLEGKWVLDGEAPSSEHDELWAALRDALGFKPGFNTTVSA